jgi:hypothetical protein
MIRDYATKRIPLEGTEKDLLGKTIAEVWREGYIEYDDEPFFLIKMTDGTVWCFEGTYGGYSPRAEDEYLTFIRVDEVKEVEKK